MIAICLLVAALCLGCSNSTDPFGDEDFVPIAFSPRAQGQAITLAEELEFTVAAPEANILKVNWKRGGLPVSTDHTYRYVPSTLGVDTLRVQADADGTNKTYFWVITVESEPSTSPPAVPAVGAQAGPAPGDVLLSWNRVSVSAFPLDEYVIAMSHIGEITSANWDQARELTRVPHRQSQVGYQENFTINEDGMVEGAEIWLAVRAVDELGQMSPIGNNGFTLTTISWWLNGFVEDESGIRHPSIIVNSAVPSLSTNTDLAGEFRLGPFRSIDDITLTTKGSLAPGSGWYNFTTQPLDSLTSDNLRIVLITRHIIDLQCSSVNGQFLNMFRSATRTSADDPVLRRWTSFPITCYIPEKVNGAGIDFADSARFALAFWDSVMGESYFVETTDQVSAQLVFRFDESADHLFGEVTLLKPVGLGLELGDVIPEQMQVYVNDSITIACFAKEIALHEIGHALGLLAHSNCGDATFIMNAVPSGNLNQAHPIHPDEQKMVRTIYALPQNTDMSQFSLN